MITVIYKNLMTSIPESEVDKALEEISKLPRSERKRVEKSVISSLDKFSDMAPEKIAEIDYQNIAMDIAIMFSFRVYYGDHEQYKAPTQ